MKTGYDNLGFRDSLLGRYVPNSWTHMDKYPLKLSTVSQPTPVVVGVNWYAAFDNPQKVGREWWINQKNLGSLRGGHCVCLPCSTKEPPSFYTFYDQKLQGSCVAQGASRAVSYLNRRRYDAFWLWNKAKEIDEWTETNPGDDNGTSVRAAMDVLRDAGHVRVLGKKSYEPNAAEGISANRWATDINDVLEVLAVDRYKKRGAIPFFNSWGKFYPRITWVPCEVWQRLLNEYGEFAIITDK